MFFLWLNFIVWTVSALFLAIATGGMKVAVLFLNPVLAMAVSAGILLMAIRSTYRLGHEYGRRNAGGPPTGLWAGPTFWKLLQGISAVLGIASFFIQVFPVGR